MRGCERRRLGVVADGVQRMAPTWSRDRLQRLIREGLGDLPLIVVSNREPWIHRRWNGGVRVQRPASGLVTALEPFAEASGGTWIAHGSGDADALSVDGGDAVAVPPDQPRYRLRRVWLSPAEQEGYYIHLANRGLWPLCHVAFVSPHFEQAHWHTYQQVNARFAQAVLEEAAGEAALVFLHDYHLALVPQMLRQANPKLLLVQFWHVPWPNLELLRPCPQADALIEGLLGNDLLGFQIPAHARNFLDAADRLVEALEDATAALVILLEIALVSSEAIWALPAGEAVPGYERFFHTLAHPVLMLFLGLITKVNVIAYFVVEECKV